MILSLPVGKGLAKFLGFLGAWWREIFIIALIALVWLQITRVHARDATIESRDATIQSMKDGAKVAESQSAARGAITGQEAVGTYVERNEEDRPVVERVVERVRNVCLRPKDPVRVPVPQGSAVAHEAAAGTGDGEDRTFAEAIGRDLATCKTELNKLRGLQNWVLANSR